MSRYYHLVSVNKSKSGVHTVVFKYDGQLWEASMAPIRKWCNDHGISFSWSIDYIGICSMTFRFHTERYRYMIDMIDAYLSGFSAFDAV